MWLTNWCTTACPHTTRIHCSSKLQAARFLKCRFLFI
uniref:Uncharacterized protein n=2 Tax=Anguilla anguilla TaxID=7936 RepID=A0A0E9RY81_ANGAN